MDACEDGDVVLLLRGIHNGLGQACLVDKRILIRGEGALKEATVDCRSNVPLFRVTRPCVIQNVDIDFTGFSQAIHVEGGENVDALIENCRIKCSGDDGICVDGSARPTFRNCDVTGKKSGLRTAGKARAELVDCKLHCCETTGVKTFGESHATLRDCHVENCQARSTHYGPHTAAFSWCTPFLEDFPSRRTSPPIPRFQSRRASTPFNSASDAFERHPDVRSYREDAATAAAVLLPAVGTGAYLDALEKRDFDVFDPGLIRGTMPLVTQARIGWNAYRGTY